MARAKKTKPQLVKKHPDEWQKDLNPGQTSGQNLGPIKLSDVPHRTAADDKELSRRLKDFTDDELGEIPIAPPDVRLEQGAVYLDLRHPGKGPCVATGNMMAGPENLYTPKSEVPYEIWNRLLETLCPRKLATEPEQELSEEMIDETLAQSFPASDPPAWTTGRERKTTSAKIPRRRTKPTP